MKKKIVPLSFALSAVLFLFAALEPVSQGQALNATFLSIGALSFVLALVIWRKAGNDSGPPGS
jgi:hypothetical protein